MREKRRSSNSSNSTNIVSLRILSLKEELNHVERDFSLFLKLIWKGSFLSRKQLNIKTIFGTIKCILFNSYV